MHLADRIAAEDSLALAAPVSLNIVCFGFIGENEAERNRRVVELLHEDGQFAPSLTFLNGHPVVRAAIMNHRTLKSDMDGFIDRLILLDASYGQDEGSR
jgi:glutamate/tyrosine decarboxylase-like PLP-dependent enzyme